jgi:hypothetical protein
MSIEGKKKKVLHLFVQGRETEIRKLTFPI